MAIVKVLTKNGDILEHKVEECASDVYIQLTTEHNFQKTHYVMLTDKKTGGAVVFQKRFIYQVIDG